MVGLAIAFLLLALFVQLGFAMTARNAAEAAVAASARRAARPEADLLEEQAALAALLAGTVPGADELRVLVRVEGETARASASFLWIPPGPRWAPLSVTVEASSPRVVPP